jgi:hypothetical protein
MCAKSVAFRVTGSKTALKKPRKTHRNLPLAIFARYANLPIISFGTVLIRNRRIVLVVRLAEKYLQKVMSAEHAVQSLHISFESALW